MNYCALYLGVLEHTPRMFVYCSIWCVLEYIFREHSLKKYKFFKFDLSDPSIAIDKVNKCISNIRTWMIKNILKINYSKTEFLVLTSSFLMQHFNDLNNSVGNSRIAPSISARNFGVIFDNHMTNK